MRFFKPVIMTAAAILSTSAMSATWFAFVDASTVDAYYFFDADTVIKDRDVTTIWLKTVRKVTADNDGAWANAAKWKVGCKARTIQTLTSSDYDKAGQFIKSYNNPESVNEIVPDSVGETVSKIACAADFPKNTSGKDYFKINDNDVFASTRRALEARKSTVDSAPK